MGAGLGRMPLAIGWLFFVVGFSMNASAASPSEGQLRRWVRDLDADNFAIREAAAGHLKVAGPQAVSLLSECVSSGSAEAAWRASAVLVAIKSAHQDPSNVGFGDAPADGEAPRSDGISAFDPSKPPPAPEPPPEVDLAQALAPPPLPLPLEAIGEQVLIADAYVSPQLTGEHPVVEAVPQAKSLGVPATQPMVQPSRSIAAVPQTQGNSGVTFVHYPAARSTIPSNRENQPRWMNFLNRTRAVLGLSAR